MRIISKFRDYYDCIQNTTLGSQLPLFLRDSREFNYDKQLIGKDLLLYNNIKNYLQLPRLEGAAIGAVLFCGQAYPFYNISGKFCYIYEDILNAYVVNDTNLLSHKSRSMLEDNVSMRDKRMSRWRNNNADITLSDLSPKTWERHLNEYNSYVSDDIHRLANTPIITIHNHSGYYSVWGYNHNKAILNPNLSNFSFMRVIEPAIAYQRIEMYLDNNMVKEVDSNVNMTDALKVHAHGFDKWSFRKKVR